MMIKALEQFQDEHGVKLEKITPIKLEGEGTINRRVDRYAFALFYGPTRVLTDSW
jgi:hypothetical protein